jgi:N-carbamoyl-L-amino-acid hydrolase
MRSLEWLAQRPREAGSRLISTTASAMYSAPAQKFEPKLLAGSHLESQNFAGWLDGPFDIIYALEVAGTC